MTMNHRTGRAWRPNATGSDTQPPRTKLAACGDLTALSQLSGIAERMVAVSTKAGCRVHWKPNLRSNPGACGDLGPNWFDQYPDVTEVGVNGRG